MDVKTKNNIRKKAKNILYTYMNDGENCFGSGESIEDCKRQIDELDE